MSNNDCGCVQLCLNHGINIYLLCMTRNTVKFGFMAIQQFPIKVVLHIVKVAFYHRLGRGNLIPSLYPMANEMAFQNAL